ncbi:SpoIIE family protein phosphatase [Stieleria sp. ICT_E10.1]|uniref:PP2C family protein-serine/threonine phosphatase n=1 Tax=Stieleria sedimenti TaxID=2976331 RepID=UPI00217F6C08|nr:SpoIIE family protein phosphatase [Stieleria sedimenti]MCS7466920.1 SpoIIE family protein phosphatase [Stieleria sedimenti]
MKILIAEDEEFSRNLLQAQLESLGHNVVAVSSGSHAWGAMQQERFSMVITDWMMPDVDGLELVRRIRTHPESGYVYIILLTGKSERTDLITGMLRGADDFLSKPYDRDELDVRIRAGERVINLERSLKAKNEELARSNQEIERTSQRIKRDLDEAARIQKSLLPRELPQNDVVDFAWIFRPCDELAGDIFNVFQLDEDNIGFYLLDVVGHGLPAALLSVTLSRFISPSTSSSALFPNVASDTPFLSPSKVASALNEQFPMDGIGQQYFTLLYGCLNLCTREMQYVAAGHPGPVVIPANDAPRIVQVEGYPIGLVDQPEYADRHLSLAPGDRVMLYSDGVLDCQNTDGEHFGEDRLIAAVNERRESLNEDVQSLNNQLVSWCGGRTPDDDISLLAMQLLDE